MSRRMTPAEAKLWRARQAERLGPDHPFWEGKSPPGLHPEVRRSLEARARNERKKAQPPPPSPEVAAFSTDVEKELHRLRTRKEARRLLQAEEAETLELPEPRRLDVLQAEEDRETPWLVEDLWPVGGNVVLAAQAKAGKTTTVTNLLRCLVDGDPFLGEHATAQVPGVFLFDLELAEHLLRSWYRDQAVAHPERVHVVSLRGQARALNLLDDDTRSRWAEVIRATGSSVVVVDPALPLLNALGLDPNHEVGPMLDAFSALVHEAGAAEGLVVHHAGHHGERSGGDSRWRGWPEAEWFLARQDETPSSPRFFSAYGRDVDSPERRVLLQGSRLTVENVSRREARVHDLVGLVVEVVTEKPGLNAKGLRDAVAEKGDGVRAQDVTKATDKAYRQGLLHVVDGQNRSKLHYPGAATDFTP